MTLSLFQTPGSIAFLDDDSNYLDTLALVIPPEWHARFFMRPQSCIHQLQLETGPWEDDLWAQQQIINRWRENGTPLIPQILEYWSTPNRYALARICVVDYSMPAMNGLQVLEKLANWRGARVLLTGQADEQIAVKAFNQGLIEQFIPKQAPDITQRLINTIRRLQATAGGRNAPLWRATLSQRQYTLLRLPSIDESLTKMISQKWVEHVVIGSPFGVLGRDGQGRTSWLQLEPASGLEELADLADAAGLDYQSIIDIQNGRRLMNLELRQSLDAGAALPELRPAFTIGHDEPLLGAWFDIGSPTGVRPKTYYDQWLGQQPVRTVIS